LSGGRTSRKLLLTLAPRGVTVSEPKVIRWDEWHGRDNRGDAHNRNCNLVAAYAARAWALHLSHFPYWDNHRFNTLRVTLSLWDGGRWAHFYEGGRDVTAQDVPDAGAAVVILKGLVDDLLPVLDWADD
jgi:hypothetical protein